jgi:hypothetical protein
MIIQRWRILDFNQSHISYQGEADTSSRGNALPVSVGKHKPATGHHGQTFVISNAEHEDLAREEYDHVLEELRQ